MEIRATDDGSLTIFAPLFGETYHSINGAITESKHVFIDAGLRQIHKSPIHILEIGFGTGLNAFLTLLESETGKQEMQYHTIERYPIDENIFTQLKYPAILAPDKENIFLSMHQTEWNKNITVNVHFQFKKIKDDIQSFDYGIDFYNLVYFDAFSPNIQPELWTEAVFDKIYKSMIKGGILTTYCAKGQIRRNMQTVGFKVERLPGPPGKREMLRAIKC
jgi:tRNA U34 5-methylaminomethyl-2-thiouridine-forming methyltransferase MnmC